MVKMEHYHFRPSELPKPIRDHLLRTEDFRFSFPNHQDEMFTVGIVDPSANSAVPNFTGMPDGQNLYISEEALSVPSLQEATLRHEILCCRNLAGVEGHSCTEIENAVLAEYTPFPDVLEGLIAARLRMFRALVAFMGIDPDRPKDSVETGILATRRYLENLATGKGIIVPKWAPKLSASSHLTASR